MAYSNKLFRDVDAFCAHFECPKSFTYWSIIQATSILAAGQSKLIIGSDTIPLNLFTILCGSPSVKAKQAIKLCRDMLDDSQYEHFLPDNLGLRKTSGLLVAMLRKQSSDAIEEDDISSLELATSAPKQNKNARDCAAFFGENTGPVASNYSTPQYTNTTHAKAYVSDDFASFCSGAQTDFYGLLMAMWECKNYSLSSPKGMLKLTDPYMNIFASMTQLGLMDTFPDSYVGMNALSSFIVVFEEKPRQRCPYRGQLDQRSFIDITQALAFVRDNPLTLSMSADAMKAGSEYYEQPALEEDTRLLTYAGLRHNQLHRVAACLALYENRNVISGNDIHDANALLSEAELRLGDALGEFGNSKISAGRQKCMDLLKREEIMKKSLYRARCASFLYSKDFEIFLTDMMVQKKIIEEWNAAANDYNVIYNPNWRKKNGNISLADINDSGIDSNAT